MIKVMVGNGHGVETKTYGVVGDFLFALSMMKRDNRYQFIVAKTEKRGAFYAAVKGPAGRWAGRKWGQGAAIESLGLGDDSAFCGICKVRVTPMMGLCPFCEMRLTSD
jgi:hypothetical protein